MEFLRFGSSIPGSYWGCCAVDIIQNFNKDPDEKAAIQLVAGDGGGPITSNGEMLFAGPTYRDIFFQRIRSGTFDKRDMPNHAFLAILTSSQLQSKAGLKWMKILHETGFEFIQSVANSVYTGAALSPHSQSKGQHLNHIFMLVRNIGSQHAGNPYDPPAAWKKLTAVVPERWHRLEDTQQLAAEVHSIHTEIWNKIGEPTFLPRSAIPEGVPVWLAGTRVPWAQQQTEADREHLKIASGQFKDQKIQTSLKEPAPTTETPPKMGFKPLPEGLVKKQVGKAGDEFAVAKSA